MEITLKEFIDKYTNIVLTKANEEYLNFMEWCNKNGYGTFIHLVNRRRDKSAMDMLWKEYKEYKNGQNNIS